VTLAVVELRVTALESLNFALVHNSVPLVREIAVTNESNGELHELTVTATLGPFARPWSATIGRLAPGATHHFEDLTFDYDDGLLLNATERDLATLRVTVEADGGAGQVNRTEHTQPVAVLAYNEWERRADAGMLASFVLPNHPALDQLLEQARKALGERTGNPALDGYQSKNPERVRSVAQAVYEGLARLPVTYANPPASFEETGQKIRTPEQVFTGQVATCLDISVLFAAALEQIGLHPLVVLVKGHAFPGVWLVDDYRGDGGFGEGASLRNEVKLGTIEVWDSSASVQKPALEFDAAVREARRALQDDEDFRFSVDVRGARSLRYRPLPSRVYGAGFDVVREVPVPIPGEPARVAVQPAEARPDQRKAELENPELREAAGRIRFWQQQLLDLTLRNRLLNYLTKGKGGLKLRCPDLGLLEDMLASEQSLLLHPASQVFSGGDQRSVEIRRAQTGEQVDEEYARERLAQGIVYSESPEEDHLKRLTLLLRKGKESFEEGGAHTTYLALGLLRWFEAPGSELERLAPVLLYPVQLERGTARAPWAFRMADEAPTFNPSLAQKLLVEHGIDLSSLCEELPGDDAGVDLQAVFARVREAIRGIPRWELREEAHLSNFSFTKLMMWRDLEQLRDNVVDRPLLRVLAKKGQESFPTGDGIPDEQELDQRFPPAEVFCPVDADSSQLAAVLGAAGGESFVLQGPPGTGKSQTITNLITHCIAAGKSVLFVSAKMAALDVVHRRLQRAKMGAFCLQLHSHSASKKAVLEQFSQALNVTTETPAEFDTAAGDLATLRGELTAYVDGIHRTRVQGESLRTGMASLCNLRHAPRNVSLDFGAAERLSSRDRELRVERLRAIAELLAKLGAPRAHPLHASRLTVWNPALEDELARALDEAEQALTTLGQTLASVGALIGRSLEDTADSDIAALCHALEALGSDAAWVPEVLTNAEPHAICDRALAFIDLGEERDALRAQVTATYDPALLSLPLEQLALKLRIWGTAFFLVAFFMLWSTRRLLASVRRDGRLPTNRTLLEDVEAARRLHLLDQRGVEAPPELESLLSVRTASSNTSAAWPGLRDRVQKSFALRRELDELRGHPALAGVSDRLAALTAAPIPPGITNLVAAREGLERASSAVQRLLALSEGWRGQHSSLNETRAALVGLRSGTSSLRDWARYQALCGELLTQPEGRLVEAVEDARLDVKDLEAAFRRGYDQTWVAHEYGKEPAVRAFDGDAHSRKIARFRTQDGAFADLAARKARARLAARVPSGDAGEMGKLRRELAKQRKHLPIRKLFAEIPTVRRRLKPCLLMSPLSVAQYLSPAERFDVVIFDEASQLPTADAIGAIARGQQLIVVGDSKQLPPTTFFAQSNEDDGSQEHTADEVESILDECLASQMRELRLRWHYRSQHEHLIAFSNHYYYDDGLFTFATANDREGRLGLKLVQVSGYYEKGRSRTNRAEAEALVAEVVRRLRDPEESERSLGIVTFSVAQQTLVQDLLDQQRAKHPEIERFFGSGVPEPVFVKNLENVQGDERDVVLFSVCYGPDEQGKVSMNFGPLNQEGGERRLNVAVTRSRQQLVVYSTLRADQIDLRRTRATGVRHLRRFLEYVARGPAAIAEAVSVDGALRFDSPFEEQIHLALRKRGYDVATQVGCSGYRIDMAVVDPERPGRFLLGIECDGAAYHSAKTARDRDRLREAVLRSLGWRLHRIWSTDFWVTPERVLEQLVAAIEEARASRASAPLLGANSNASTQGPSPEDQEPPANPSRGITPAPPAVVELGLPYKVATLPTSPVAFEITATAAQSLLAADIQSVLATEAPVSLRMLGARLAPRWGIGRVTQRTLHHLAYVISARHLGKVHGEFAWRPEQSPADYREIRRPGEAPDSERPIEEIPLEELMAAGLALLENSLSIPEDELIKGIARAFGIRRAGKNVVERGIEAVAGLVASERVVRNDTTISLPS